MHCELNDIVEEHSQFHLLLGQVLEEAGQEVEVADWATTLSDTSAEEMDMISSYPGRRVSCEGSMHKLWRPLQNR